MTTNQERIDTISNDQLQHVSGGKDGKPSILDRINGFKRGFNSTGDPLNPVTMATAVHGAIDPHGQQRAATKAGIAGLAAGVVAKNPLAVAAAGVGAYATDLFSNSRFGR